MACLSRFVGAGCIDLIKLYEMFQQIVLASVILPRLLATHTRCTQTRELVARQPYTALRLSTHLQQGPSITVLRELVSIIQKNPENFRGSMTLVCFMYI